MRERIRTKEDEERHADLVKLFARPAAPGLDHTDRRTVDDTRDALGEERGVIVAVVSVLWADLIDDRGDLREHRLQLAAKLLL